MTTPSATTSTPMAVPITILALSLRFTVFRDSVGLRSALVVVARVFVPAAVLVLEVDRVVSAGMSSAVVSSGAAVGVVEFLAVVVMVAVVLFPAVGVEEVAFSAAAVVVSDAVAVVEFAASVVVVVFAESVIVVVAGAVVAGVIVAGIVVGVVVVAVAARTMHANARSSCILCGIQGTAEQLSGHYVGVPPPRLYIRGRMWRMCK